MGVEDLHLYGAVWQGNRIGEPEDEQGVPLEDPLLGGEMHLPPMVIRPVKGPAPKGPEWFSCPLIIAKADACGCDLIGSPAAYVVLRTAKHPTLCALCGVRLVAYA